MESRAVCTKMEEFDESVKGILRQPFSADELIKFSAVSPTYEPYEDEDWVKLIMEADEVDPDTYDSYIEAQVLLPKGDKYHYARVMSRKHGPHGKAIGKGNPNPVLNTRVYEVEFLDGEVLEYSANVITDNLYSSRTMLSFRRAAIILGIRPRRVGSYVCSGEMAAQAGRLSRISNTLTLSRLLSMWWLTRSQKSLPLCGGCLTP